MFNADTSKITETLATSLKGVVQYDSIYIKSIALAYLAYVSDERSFQSFSSFNDIGYNVKDNSLLFFVKDALRDVPFEIFYRLQMFSKEELGSFILHAEDATSREAGAYSTPESLCNLALSVLDVKKGESVLDNCAGMGSFLTSAYEKNSEAFYYGVDINTDATAIARIKAQVLGSNIEMEQGDALGNNFDNRLFDKVFSNYPFGMQVRYLNNGAFYLEQIKMRCPDLSKATSSDWIFNYKLVNSLKETGTGVALMTLGGLWNTIDRPIREFFIKNGYIDAIITLPQKLFSITNVPIAMIVFGKKLSKSVRIIDAGKIYTEGRRTNTLTEKDIKAIVELLEKDTDISKTISIADIAENDFVLNPTRYFTESIKVENGVEFGSLIKSISRGAPCTAQELDSLLSKEPTDFQYLMLSNIKNGVIDEELPYLKGIDQRYERFCVKNGSLLLSKNGYPFKVAIARVPDGKKLLANGNLFIIELNEQLIKSYYLKAFLESEKGIATLKSIAVGAVIPNIGLEQLKKIQIPMIPMEQQEETETKYLAVLDEIDILKRKIAKAEASLKSLFDEE